MARPCTDYVDSGSTRTNEAYPAWRGRPRGVNKGALLFMATPLGIDSESESHQEVLADSMGRFDHNWRRHVDDLADPYFCGMLMDIPAIGLSANAAFGATLGAAGAISLALCLRRDERRAAHRHH